MGGNCKLTGERAWAGSVHSTAMPLFKLPLHLCRWCVAQHATAGNSKSTEGAREQRLLWTTRAWQHGLDTGKGTAREGKTAARVQTRIEDGEH